MFGISIYAGLEQSLEENLAYLHEAKECGIKHVFTSFHIPEVNKSFKKESDILLKEAKKLGMKVMADISKGYFDEKEIQKYEFESLRLDFGFDLSEIAEMTKKYDHNIVFNASTLTRKQIEKLIQYGVDLSKVEACHNFYPREDTGISEELMIERNQVMKKYGFKTMAFVPSHNKTRGPIHKGLPTLEKHRNVDSMIAAQHLMRIQNDVIFIGDTRASKQELICLGNIKKDIMLLPIKLQQGISEVEKSLLRQVHTNRIDPGEFVIRSQEARLIKKGKIIPGNQKERKQYSVTIDNELYTRYEGELQILRKAFKKDERVNVVADGQKANILIDLIQPGEKFTFDFEDK